MEPLQAVVLALVAVALSVAVALWLANVATQHTGLELLEIRPAAYRQGGKVLLTIRVWNRGAATATVLQVKVNGQPYPVQQVIQPGGEAAITLEVETPAQTIQTSITTTRNEYPLIVKVQP